MNVVCLQRCLMSVFMVFVGTLYDILACVNCFKAGTKNPAFLLNQGGQSKSKINCQSLVKTNQDSDTLQRVQVFW